VSLSSSPVPLPILVVEDEPAVMEFMRAALERSGYATVAASSGVEALQLLAGGEYLGVITDMRTPGGVSGADVHAWIGAHRRDLVLQYTGAPCVEKPFRVQQLIAMVEKIFGKPQ